MARRSLSLLQVLQVVLIFVGAAVVTVFALAILAPRAVAAPLLAPLANTFSSLTLTSGNTLQVNCPNGGVMAYATTTPGADLSCAFPDTPTPVPSTPTGVSSDTATPIGTATLAPTATGAIPTPTPTTMPNSPTATPSLSPVSTLSPSATAASASYRSAILADNPLAYWRLGEASGTVAVDAQGAHNGAYVAGPTLGAADALAGDPDTAATFNGTSQYASVPYAASLNPTTFSVEVWAKSTGGAGTYRGVMASRSYPNGWVLYAGNDNSWQFWLNSGTTMPVVSGGSVVPNAWTYLVATYDGTTARLYVNGGLVGSRTVANYHPNPSKVLTIGQGEPGAGFFFPGSVDEAAVYGVALSASQITSHYLTGTVGGPTATAIAATATSFVATSTALATITPGAPTSTALPPTATALAATPSSTSVAGGGTTFYVSTAATGTQDGRSWATAWKQPGLIVWSSVKPGDTVLLDGGVTACPSPFYPSTSPPYDFPQPRPGFGCGMLYTTALIPASSGTAAAPITVKLASEAGRNGTAVLFGGRTTSLPYCNQASWSGNASTFNTAINVAGYHDLVIDGGKRSGITLYGAKAGIVTSSATSNVVFRNIESFDQGVATHGNVNSEFGSSPYGSPSGWWADGWSVSPQGNNLTFDRDLFHDDGQDALHTGGTINNLTISNSWLYFSREHPVDLGYAFMAGPGGRCIHPDGFQSFSGGPDSGLVVKDSIIGPYVNQGLYPTDDTAPRFNNATITNVLFLDNIGSAINIVSSAPSGWVMSNLTFYRPGNGGCCAIDGNSWPSGDRIDNSINVGGDTNVPGLGGSGNIHWQGSALPGSTQVDPQFVSTLTTNTPTFVQIQNVDTTARCASCAGKGASLHKTSDILALIDGLNP